jgi:hypothetical protein
VYNNSNFFSYPNYHPKSSLFNNFKRLNFGEILNGTQKTLNVINQAIPIFYQIKPLWNNAKTMLKIASVINTDERQEKIVKNNTKSNTTNKEITKKENNIKYNEPVFFI